MAVAGASILLSRDEFRILGCLSIMPPPPSLRSWSDQPSPLIVSVPHGGRLYASPIEQPPTAPKTSLQIGEDRFVDFLGLAALRSGASLLIQRIPRAYIDLNRSETEMEASAFYCPDKPWRACAPGRQRTQIHPVRTACGARGSGDAGLVERSEDKTGGEGGI